MKKILAALTVIISFALIAQPGKGNGSKGKGKPNKSQKVFKGSSIKGKPKGKAKPLKFPKANGKKGGSKGIFHPGGGPNKVYKPKHHFKYKKGHVNHIYMYNFGPYTYPTKNYGQWRSQQAKMKHKKYRPLVEADALDAIVMIQDRNAFLVLQINNKVERYNRLVIERHNAGLISDVEFGVHILSIKRMKTHSAAFSLYL